MGRFARRAGLAPITGNVSPCMSTHRANFETWYKKVLELLYPHRDAGFAILLLAFPLLERYLRHKKGLKPDQSLTDPFYDELVLLFPVLKDNATARNFWQVYRNGLLHEITLSRQTRSGAPMPVGWLSHDKPMITIETDGSMWINPPDFAQLVVATIELDFITFEGAMLSTPLPTVKSQPAATSSAASPAHRPILGTNTGP